MMAGKCEYEVTVMNRKLAKPVFEQKCSLTSRACLCPEDALQCTRRVYAHAYELKRHYGEIQASDGFHPRG
jgi:hypothetical protein